MKWQLWNTNLIFKTDKALEKEPLTVDPDYQEEFEEYPEDYEDELEFPGKDFNFMCLPLFVGLVADFESVGELARWFSASVRLCLVGLGLGKRWASSWVTFWHGSI